MRILPVLLLTGCFAEVGMDLDADEDGLLESEEETYQTDPDDDDSDDDGYTDGDEVHQNTNPADAGDKPYQAGWPIDACRHDVESNGSEIGDVANDFALLDQFGETVRLHDFCDQVVYMVFAAFW